MTSVHRLFTKQITKARLPSGEVDIDALGEFVSAAYEESDRDRTRTDRSISLMVEELDHLTRGLERLVAERTAELRERESELQAQNLRFDAAINNMSQGLVMFDGAARLVICNARYIDMYGLPPQLTQPGARLVELLRYRIANGTFAVSAEQFVQMVLEKVGQGERVNRIIELPDGRTISVMLHPMHGGGWVATHDDITERRQAEQQIAHMARHDPLTDLPNRSFMREQLEQALLNVDRGERLAVLYVDLDHFKTVNDTLGHSIGDELLRHVAARLRSCLRQGDTVARVGGDEFSVIQVGIDSPADAAALARRLREAIRMPYEISGHAVMIDATVGISLAPGDGAEPDKLLKNADMALYRAKGDGRGAYRFFEPEMDARMQERRMLELALRDALPRGQFELYYQPLINLSQDRITSLEALLRWHHPSRGLVAPGEFIPVAEDIGLIVPLGEWVIRTACTHATLWPKDITVSVNISPIQLESTNFVSVVTGALAASRLEPARLELEITEAVLLEKSQGAMAALHQLRGLGVRVAMDDFGTGHSSLHYLCRFPFDKIKLDRRFITDMADGHPSRAVVRAVADLAAALKMTTTAEGVETEEELAQVRSLGCTEMQGYVFSPPMKLDQILLLLARSSSTRISA